MNARQRQALEANAPTADDILNNPDFMAELNEEITYTLDKKGLDSAPAEDFVDVVDAAVAQGADPDADLERINAAIEAARAEEAALRAQEAQEAAQEPEMTREEAIRAQILDLLQKTPGAPTEAQIAAMKRQYGENGVQVLALGEGDVYVYTYLRRSQWKKIQEMVAKAAQTEAFAAQAEDMLKEKVIQYTVLWPKNVSSPEFLHNSRAGVMDTLYQVVMLNSYFLEPAQALQLTMAL